MMWLYFIFIIVREKNKIGMFFLFYNKKRGVVGKNLRLVNCSLWFFFVFVKIY